MDDDASDVPSDADESDDESEVDEDISSEASEESLEQRRQPARAPLELRERRHVSYKLDSGSESEDVESEEGDEVKEEALTTADNTTEEEDLVAVGEDAPAPKPGKRKAQPPAQR